jgi:hypothetical protein
VTLEYNVTYHEPEPTPIGLVQGQEPGSKEEWWVALALWKLQMPFSFQVPVMGGRDRKGGFIVDFVVYNPIAVPVEVFGNYWHEGDMGAGDSLRLALYRQYFGRETVIIWGSEAVDEDATLEVVRRKLL